VGEAEPKVELRRLNDPTKFSSGYLRLGRKTLTSYLLPRLELTR